MGAEARCQLQVDGAVHDGKALLETDELLFRGDKRGTERAVRLAIPLASIRSVSGTNGALRLRFDGGEATFLLGAHAEKWAEKIRSPKSLIDKLDVKPEHTVSVVALDDSAFVESLRARAARVAVGRITPRSSVIFLGAEDVAALSRVEGDRLGKAGCDAPFTSSRSGVHGGFMPNLACAHRDSGPASLCACQIWHGAA